MYFKATSLIVFLTFRGAIAAGGYSHLLNHEKADYLPSGWTFHSRPIGSDPIPLRIALTDSSETYLEVATSVSDPQSSEYGQYLSKDELHRIIHSGSNHPGADPVKAWLRSSGAKDVAQSGEWIHFTTTAQQACKLINAEFNKYSYRNKDPVYRALSYDIPGSLREHIDFIYPISQFFLSLTDKPRASRTLAARQHIPTGPATCNDSTCPEQIRSLYEINYSPPDNLSQSRIGIAGFLEQYANTADNDYFQANYANRTTLSPGFEVELVNEGENPQNDSLSGVEAMLDVEYVQAFTGQLNVTYFSTGGRPPTLNSHGTKPVELKRSQNEPFLDFLQYLSKMNSPPQVISISYSDTEQTVPARYAKRVCKLFARLAIRGVSVIGASGDGGASGTSNSDCKRPDGSTMFLPTFPSSCPWYTSVGSTASYGGGAAFSSGGFSNVFAVPTWQKASTSSFLRQNGKRHAGYFNASGRGIPDVSLVGDDYLIWRYKFSSAHDGTSASTPVFAAMVALLNDLRLRNGKPVLGFLNPLLYSADIAAAFTDIKSGQSNGCANKTGFEPGWRAVKGWDPVTGLGTPNFRELSALLE